MVFFDSPLFIEGILPFLLVFVLIFAILQKSKVLGEGKAQIDALISLAIALILLVFPTPRNLIVNLVPWLAVGIVVILVFMLMYGLVAGDISTGEKWMKVTFGILAGVFLIGVILYVTDLWSFVEGWFTGSGGSEVLSTILLLVIIGGAFALAIATGKKSDKVDT